MNKNELIDIIRNGEDSKHQFKQDATNATSLASEMVAFSNSQEASGGSKCEQCRRTGSPPYCF